MDVFEFRERLVGEYGQFTRSFTRFRSEDIARFVTTAYESQRYWPAPLVQVNPNFKTGRLASLYDIENREAVFQSVHRSYKFCLLTLSCVAAAEFACFATRAARLADPRQCFRLTPDEFRLIHPNTLTCPGTNCATSSTPPTSWAPTARPRPQEQRNPPARRLPQLVLRARSLGRARRHGHLNPHSKELPLGNQQNRRRLPGPLHAVG